MWVDLGAYGVPRVIKEGGKWDAKQSCRAMEHWTRQVGCEVWGRVYGALDPPGTIELF